MIDDSFKKKIVALKDLGFVGLADIGGRAISAVFWFYIITLMDTTEYGLLNYYVGIASLAQLMSLVGTTNALTVFVSKGIKIQSTFFAISLFASSISSIILFIIFQRPDIIFLLMMIMVSDSVGGVLLGKKSYSIYARYNLIQKALQIALGAGFFHMFGLNGIIYGIASSYLLFVPLFYKLSRETKFDLTLLRGKRNFIITNYVVMLTSGFRRDVDKLIIPVILGFAALGHFSLAVQVYTLLMTASMSFFKYILPQDAVGNQNKKLKNFVILFTVILVVIGIATLPTIISSLFPKYIESIEIVQIMTLSVIPATINMIHYSKFTALERGKLVLIITAAQLATMTLGFVVLGSIFEMRGVAVSFVLSFTVAALCGVYLNRLIGNKNVES
jgi:O-antigen/teichoic acid export membrane protein